jgi:hypothetical protein
MHGHREKPFLCTFEGCERGVPGNGFPRHWNLCDHMKRIHNRYPSPQTGGAKPPRRSKESKSSTSESTTTEKTRVPASSLSWSEQYQHGHQQLMSDLMDIPDLGDVEAAEQEIKIATDYLKLMARATQQMKPVPWMEQTISKQSPSVHSLASSGYQEIIFDSNSAHSSSHGSACSGRSGPLDKVAITAMRLVKAVGACWKCKFLRKKVSKTYCFWWQY